MRIRLAVVVSTILLSAASASAAPPEAMQASVSRSLARCVDDSAVFVVHVDLRRFDLVAGIKQLVTAAGQPIFGVDLPGLNSLATSIEGFRGAGVNQLYAVFAPSALDSRNPYFVALIEPGQDVQRAIQQFRQKSRDATPLFDFLPNARSFRHVFALGDAVVAGDGAFVAELRRNEPMPRPELAAALAAAGASPAALLIVPSADQRRALEETLPDLPETISGGATSVITHGLNWATIGYGDPQQTLKLTVHSSDRAAAETLQQFVRDLPRRLSGFARVQSLFPTGQLPDSLVPAVQDNTLTLTLPRSDPNMAALEKNFVDIGKDVQLSSHRTARRNHLKQIMLALHNYHDVHGRFPAATNYDKQGRPLLSWRVHLLPYLEENGLFQEFHLDEPWDSEHNKKLLARIPPVFRADELKFQDYGKTTLLGVAGKRAVFHGREGVRIRDITDGTSSTIMVVDVPPASAVLWTKPEDFDADAPKPLVRLLGGRDGFSTAFCDGSVQFFTPSIPESTLRALFTINGGEIIQLENR